MNKDLKRCLCRCPHFDYALCDSGVYPEARRHAVGTVPARQTQWPSGRQAQWPRAACRRPSVGARGLSSAVTQVYAGGLLGAARRYAATAMDAMSLNLIDVC